MPGSVARACRHASIRYKANPVRVKVCIAVVALFASVPACAGPWGAGGGRVRVTVLSAEQVELDGRKLSWEELDRALRARVRAAREADADRPPVALNALVGVAQDQMNRIIDVLQAAGVRQIDIGPQRRR